jgi:murein DD-endopeptidase MepM/ murein hydrolase activator NlpD
VESNNQKKDKKRSWFKKINDKYRLIFLNEQTLEERFSLRLSRLNVIALIFFFVIVIVSGTFLLIAHTSLKEFIPGYTELQYRQEMYGLLQKADSLELEMQRKDTYLKNIRIILSDSSAITELYSVDTVNNITDSNAALYADIEIDISPEDSLLRAEYEQATQYNLRFKASDELYEDITDASDFLFYPPVDGTVTSKFNPIIKHFGVDIVTAENEPVLATLDGTVLISNWTTETGYVIAIQHRHDLISVYKHNAVLLKKQGDYVEAGEAIAIVGDSGEISTGPHLHFEVWYKGNPMNPAKFLNF